MANNNKNSHTGCAWFVVIGIIILLALCGGCHSHSNSNSGICSKAGCSKEATNHGYCTTHYFEAYSKAYEYNHRND